LRTANATSGQYLAKAFEKLDRGAEFREQVEDAAADQRSQRPKRPDRLQAIPHSIRAWKYSDRARAR
jgi:hypothetical protein